MEASFRRSVLLKVILSAVLVLGAFLPQMSRAQTAAPADDLRATIRAELLSDPRTTGLSEAQISAMVDVLTQEAQKQGLTSRDILWRPAPTSASPEPQAPVSSCGNMPSILCAINAAFGFDGSDLRIPIGLGVSSMLLIFLIASMIEVHHRRHPRTNITPSSAV